MRRTYSLLAGRSLPRALFAAPSSLDASVDAKEIIFARILEVQISTLAARIQNVFLGARVLFVICSATSADTLGVFAPCFVGSGATNSGLGTTAHATL